MIPLTYQLRRPVRLELTAAGSWRVVSQSPLSALTVNPAAARLLELTRQGATVGDMAAVLRITEQRVLSLCEYFRQRGILEVGPAEASSGYLPRVTVIIPTRDRAADLDECLTAISRLDYPPERLESIVVDDGSAEPAVVAAVAARHGARLLVNEENRGPAFSRNRAAEQAAGEVLAFVDSDCVAAPEWLVRLVPHFAWDKVGAVGGRTLGYYTDSPLDRYEEASSPLDMGKHLQLASAGRDSFYVPTCNLLVRRSLYAELAGLREDLRMGEDVDLCWRLRATGAYLVYAPEGIVRHKHRSTLASMLARRAGYGTSEAVLHALHPDKGKRFPLAPLPLVTAVMVSAALVARAPRLLPACLVPVALDAGRRVNHLRREGVAVPAGPVTMSVLRGHLSMLHFLYFHLVRYYLGPMAALSVLSRGLGVLAGCAAVYSSSVDYLTRRPRLSYPAYLAYYLAEHLAYQSGVLAGCMREGSFRSYRVAFTRRSLL